LDAAAGMCGIVARLAKADDGGSSPATPATPAAADGAAVERAVARLRHRGPDAEGVCTVGRCVLGHARLAIVDVHSGAHPLESADAGAVAANGEIYNFETLRDCFEDFPFATRCDSEVLLPVCAQMGEEAPRLLRGIFGFVWVGVGGRSFTVARDPVGVVPLFWAEDDAGWWIASERKALPDVELEPFPPGHVLHRGGGGPAGAPVRPRRYFAPTWVGRGAAGLMPRSSSPTQNVADKLRAALERAVERRMAALDDEVGLGLLLSGGLDSSVIAAIAQRRRRAAGLPPLRSFAVGLEGAPDLLAARRVAAHIGTDHREVRFTVEEALAAVPAAIFAVETDDVTTVRASTPMMLLARAVRRAGCKVVLSGEGADEALCGYLYFHNSPTEEGALDESRKRVLALGEYDCLRANMTFMAAGVEARVPFLDAGVLRVCMTCGATKLPRRSDAPGAPRRPIEKALLREACADLLPPDVLWRQKEQASDGVGFAWIDTLREEAARRGTTEAEWYAEELAGRLPGVRIAPWEPKWIGSTDPSGRVAPAHAEHADHAQRAAADARPKEEEKCIAS